MNTDIVFCVESVSNRASVVLGLAYIGICIYAIDENQLSIGSLKTRAPHPH